MNYVDEQPEEKETKQSKLPSQQGYTLRIPKLNWQITALLLIALIAGFQTFQFARLKSSVTVKAATTTATTSTAAAAPAAASSAGSSDLQSQVGGC